MKIYKYDVPNELILQYCKIIKVLEKKYSYSYEQARSEVHQEIFDFVKCERAGITRDDRHFIIALNSTIADLMYEEGV